MDFAERRNYLRKIFEYDKVIQLNDNKVRILPFVFNENNDKKEIRRLSCLVPKGTEFCHESDSDIRENKNFSYSVFVPDERKVYKDCIILLHGLNERTWEKYLTWAEMLCKKTEKPVFLFPIAFHMNRTPVSWHTPRTSMPWVKLRKESSPQVSNSTFANVALSLRLASSPLRLYTSGRETILNLWQLVNQIKDGRHPIMEKNAGVDFFAYSIGAMISQIFLIGNPDQLLSDSKFFLFCGGSIFEEMNGSAREIMDNAAWNLVHEYYADHFGCIDGLNEDVIPDLNEDFLNRSFTSMLRTDMFTEFRNKFFDANKDRIRIITLKKDSVIPTHGVKLALGDNSKDILQELDFPFEYTHQNPFPKENEIITAGMLNNAFDNVFTSASAFLS